MAEESASTENNFKSVKNQYFAAFSANLIFLAHGLMVGWLSPALPILTSIETPLKSGPLTNSQISWIGSISSIAGMLGTIIFGFVCLRLGCKRTMLILALPSASFWFLIFFGDMYYHILIARFFTGFCVGGIQSTVILYITEIANNNNRGRLATFSHILRNTGVLISYTLGAIGLPYKVIPCICVFVPIIFGIIFFYLPNTPQFHMRQGQLKKAEKSMKFYKGNGNNTEESVAFLDELERMKTTANETKVEEKVNWTDIFGRTNLKGISNGIILANLSNLSGCMVVVTYAGWIFKQVGAAHNPNTSAIAIAVTQIIAIFCTSQLCDSLGRKALLKFSFLGCASGLLSFAMYSYLKHQGFDLSSFEFVPVASLSIVILTAASGIVPLMPICTIENLPSEIRTVGLLISNVFKNIAQFYCLKLFPILSASIGLHFCMVIFATSCILGTFYVHFMMEETKDKALDTISPDNIDETKNDSNKC